VDLLFRFLPGGGLGRDGIAGRPSTNKETRMHELNQDIRAFVNGFGLPITLTGISQDSVIATSAGCDEAIFP
jgi:hypothetical protein